MNPTEKRIEYFTKHAVPCAICGKQIQAKELEEIEYVKNMNGLEYFHHACYVKEYLRRM